MPDTEIAIPLFVLRPVTAKDEPFLRGLYASVRSHEMALTQWTDAQQDAFLSMQFAAQTHHYTTHYPAAVFDVIESRGTSAGRITVSRGEKTINLIDLALIPSFRRLGIGTALITQLKDEAQLVGKRVILHVENFNPARRLYERLGFTVSASDQIYNEMEWTPSGQHTANS